MAAAETAAKIEEVAPGLALLCLEERIRLGLGDHPIGHGLLERRLIGRLDGGLERRHPRPGLPGRSVRSAWAWVSVPAATALLTAVVKATWRAALSWSVLMPSASASRAL